RERGRKRMASVRPWSGRSGWQVLQGPADKTTEYCEVQGSSGAAEQAREEARLFHRLDRAMHPEAQRGVAVRARLGPTIGLAAPETVAGHSGTPSNDFYRCQ